MRTYILGTGVDTCTYDEAKNTLLKYVEENKRNVKTAVTPNPEIIMHAKYNKEYRDIINRSDLVLCDGTGVYLAARLNKIKIPQRVRGCDMCYSLFEEAKDKNISIYLLGAKPGVALKAKERLEAEYKGINIAGVNDGYFDKAKEEKVIADINALKPDILMVGLGFPKQEEWIFNNKKKLSVNVALAIGGSIDIFAGEVKRAPVIFQKLGLEWLYRLISQPSRFVRMLVLPKFAFVFLLDKLYCVTQKKLRPY